MGCFKNVMGIKKVINIVIFPLVLNGMTDEIVAVLVACTSLTELIILFNYSI